MKLELVRRDSTSVISVLDIISAVGQVQSYSSHLVFFSKLSILEEKKQTDLTTK